MEAIRKIIKIKNNSLKLVDLEDFNNQTVEVIIFPVRKKKENSKIKKSLKVSKPSLSKLKGIWKDRNIDLKTLRTEAWPERNND